MNKLIKVLSLAFVLSFAVVSCGNKQEECKDGEKKECCSKKDKEHASEEGESKSCEPGCKKECCAKKDEESEATDGEEEMQEDAHSHEGGEHDHEH